MSGTGSSGTDRFNPRATPPLNHGEGYLETRYAIQAHRNGNRLLPVALGDGRFNDEGTLKPQYIDTESDR